MWRREGQLINLHETRIEFCHQLSEECHSPCNPSRFNQEAGLRVWTWGLKWKGSGADFTCRQGQINKRSIAKMMLHSGRKIAHRWRQTCKLFNFLTFPFSLVLSTKNSFKLFSYWGDDAGQNCNEVITNLYWCCDNKYNMNKKILCNEGTDTVAHN